ncbi:MAG: hypothetical protein WCX73_00485 [Candidatus Pacearchaeota archaeon]|jgi:hypothetical protein
MTSGLAKKIGLGIVLTGISICLLGCGNDLKLEKTSYEDKVQAVKDSQSYQRTEKEYKGVVPLFKISLD